jgi:hypothetical protein
MSVAVVAELLPHLLLLSPIKGNKYVSVVEVVCSRTFSAMFGLNIFNHFLLSRDSIGYAVWSDFDVMQNLNSMGRNEPSNCCLGVKTSQIGFALDILSL